jgi:branched-chain amino acid transport system substrate-binding protein
VGGNPFAFKTIPSEVDIARGLVNWLKAAGVKSVAIVVDDPAFQRANGVAMAKAAADAGIKVTDQEVVPKGGEDFAALLSRLTANAPERILTHLADSTVPFFRAYEASGLKIPISGRPDFAKALEAVSPEFRAAGGLADLSGVAVFSPAFDKVQPFVAAYRAHYGILPTQRSFFVYEATKLVADAIRRAGADTAQAIEQALKTTTFPSALGGTYALDDHNHAHTPLLILGLRDGKPAVIAVE